jgi:hypothetical protein
MNTEDYLRNLCRENGWYFANGTNKQPMDEARAWADRATELSSWSLQRLFNRPDAFGAYTATGSAFTVKDVITTERLEAHFRASGPAAIIGAHSSVAELIPGPDGSEIVSCTSKWCATDIDHHAPGDPPPANEAAAIEWHERLVKLGFFPMTLETSGGGFRNLVVLSKPIPTPIAYAFVRWLIRDWQALGLQAEPEAFPKQPLIGIAEYGNWVRLPGPNPRCKGHFSKVWDGGEWLRGDDAINYILTLTGDLPLLIPAECLNPATGRGFRIVTPPPRPKNGSPKSRPKRG